MESFENFVEALQTKWSSGTPTLYGWQHIMFLLLMVAAVVLVCLFAKKLSDKQFRLIMLIMGCTLLVLEVGKQLVFAYKGDGTWDYDWAQFPFQFCSMPMYIMVIVGALKECKFRDYLCSFLATFGLFAGIIVMFYPSTVLSEMVFRFSQSMIHHASMVICGFIVIISGKVKFEHKTIFKAIAVFSVCVSMAFIINIVYHASGMTDKFNMFWIGPYCNSDLVVFDKIGSALNIGADHIHIGNFVFVLIYILAFSAAAYIVLLCEILGHKLACKGKSEVHDKIK